MLQKTLSERCVCSTDKEAKMNGNLKTSYYVGRVVWLHTLMVKKGAYDVVGKLVLIILTCRHRRLLAQINWLTDVSYLVWKFMF